jgi:hypothetical protein
MILSSIETISNTWKATWADKAFIRKFNLTLAVCLFVYLFVANLLMMNKDRSGMLLNDPVQAFIQPRDFSTIIFFFTYTGVIAFVLHIISRPHVMQRAFIGFTVVFVLRALMIFVLPLAPPEGQITLYDPIVDLFVVGSAQELRNDLFFSGHISDLSFFIFCANNKMLRNFLTFCAIVVGFLLVAQRVHYTADVVAAPFFAYWGYRVFVADKDSSL